MAMADPTGDPVEVALPAKVSKIDGHHSSDSSSDSDEKPSRAKSGVYRLFGRQKPVHKALGGGKYADLLLWRNKKKSTLLILGVTMVWIFFEILDHNFIKIICNITILAHAFIFLWSNSCHMINKSGPKIPDVQITDKRVLEVVSVVRAQVSRGLYIVRGVAAGNDIRKFLRVIIILWLISVMGSWFSFLTLLYTMFIALHTLPALYEKYEDKIDPIVEKASIEVKMCYAEFHDKVLRKLKEQSISENRPFAKFDLDVNEYSC